MFNLLKAKASSSPAWPLSRSKAQVVIGARRDHYDRVRPLSALDYQPPAPITLEVIAQQLPTPTVVQ